MLLLLGITPGHEESRMRNFPRKTFALCWYESKAWQKLQRFKTNPWWFTSMYWSRSYCLSIFTDETYKRDSPSALRYDDVTPGPDVAKEYCKLCTAKLFACIRQREIGKIQDDMFKWRTIETGTNIQLVLCPCHGTNMILILVSWHGYCTNELFVPIKYSVLCTAC